MSRRCRGGMQVEFPPPVRIYRLCLYRSKIPTLSTASVDVEIVYTIILLVELDLCMEGQD
jgi:hypothetical protein